MYTKHLPNSVITYSFKLKLTTTNAHLIYIHVLVTAEKANNSEFVVRVVL